MRSSLLREAAAVGPGPRRVGVVIALVAVLVPVVGLLQAGSRAHDVVVERVLVGQAATAQAVAVQLDQAWDHVLGLARALPTRTGMQDALATGDAALLQQIVGDTAVDPTYTAITAYDAAGRQRAATGTVLGPLPEPAPVGRVGPPVVTGDDSTVELVEPVLQAGRRVGTLRLQLSLAQIAPDLTLLRYGRTGTTSLVDAQGHYLLSPDEVVRGKRLASPVGLELAADHRAGSIRLFSPRFHTDVIANYAPAGDSPLGVLTRQFDSEAFASADRLQHRLRLAAAGALLLGLGLVAAGAVVLRHYRQRLDARDAEYRGLVNRSQDIITRYDAEQHLVFISPAVEQVLGYPAAAKLGTEPVELVHPDDRAAYLAALARHAVEDSVTQAYRLLHRDGHDVWVETTTVVDRAPDGALTAYDGITRDITERHRDRVALAAARDAALSASRAKSAFLANTSHELRTPLNGVLGLTEVLLGTELDGQQRTYAQTVQESGRNLLTILDDILDLAKIEAGGVVLESVVFALGRVVRRSVAPFRPLAEAKGIALDVDLHPDLPPWVCGDPTRFGQVVANLVSNAVKFTDAGRVDVRVEAEGDTVVLRVTDTGIGIAEDAVPRLFQSFTQADSSTTRRFGGTGLGLAVSRQLSELQGGTLGLRSAPGSGSTFTLRLPLPAGSAPAAVRAPAPAATVQSLRVLVAEDNAVNQLVARSMLELLGHRVAVVADGQAAVVAVLAADPPYDVVLMDCQMPVLDGYDATRAIREAEIARRTPVFGLSASAMRADRQRALDAGMDRYLTKPVVLGELAAALEALRPPVLPERRELQPDGVAG